MKIIYTEFVADPSLRRTTTNLPAHVAQVLIAQGSAKAVPMPRHGSKDWLAARNEQASLAVPSPTDTPAGVTGVEWGIQNLRSGKVNIIKRVGSDTYFFDGPPQDCPRSICQQFIGAAERSDVNSIAVAAAKQAQADRDRVDKTAGKVSVLSTIFGSGRL